MGKIYILDASFNIIMKFKKNKKIMFIAYLLVFALIITFLAYDVKVKRNVESSSYLTNYLNNSEKYGGSKVEYFGKVINISQNYFYFRSGSKEIKIYGSGIKMPVLGETIVFLDFQKDGKIRMIDYHNYDYNYIIYIISFFALIVFVVIFLKEWKLTKKGFKDA